LSFWSGLFCSISFDNIISVPLNNQLMGVYRWDEFERNWITINLRGQSYQMYRSFSFILQMMSPNEYSTCIIIYLVTNQLNLFQRSSFIIVLNFIWLTPYLTMVSELRFCAFLANRKFAKIRNIGRKWHWINLIKLLVTYYGAKLHLIELMD
jgi:hypothetical protein